MDKAWIGGAGKDFTGEAGSGSVWVGWVWFGQAGLDWLSIKVRQVSDSEGIGKAG